MSIFQILTHRNFLLPFSIVLGLILGPRMLTLKDFTPFVLGFILAISTAGFSFRKFLPLKRNIKPVLSCLLLNYLVFSALLILLAYWWLDSEPIIVGFIVMAATPPAVAIIPFTINLFGDEEFSIIGVIGVNLLAIGVIPLYFIVFTHTGELNLAELLITILKILVIPVILSRFLRHRQILPFILNHRGSLIDAGFFVISMTVLGVSRDILFEKIDFILIPSAIFVVTMFLTGYLFSLLARRAGISKQRIISMRLMLTMKNAGFAAVLALTLFSNTQVTLPAAVLSIILPIYYITYSALAKPATQ